jgi:hypothetical protein
VEDSAAQGSGSGSFAKLAELLRDPKQRKAFWIDPEGALEKAGVKPGDVPESVLEILRDLSYEELRVLARVNARLDEAGVSQADKAEMV